MTYAAGAHATHAFLLITSYPTPGSGFPPCMMGRATVCSFKRLLLMLSTKSAHEIISIGTNHTVGRAGLSYPGNDEGGLISRACCPNCFFAKTSSAENEEGMLKRCSHDVIMMETPKSDPDPFYYAVNLEQRVRRMEHHSSIGFRLAGRRTPVFTAASALDLGMLKVLGSHFRVMEATSISLGRIDITGDKSIRTF